MICKVKVSSIERQTVSRIKGVFKYRYLIILKSDDPDGPRWYFNIPESELKNWPINAEFTVDVH